MHPRVLIVGTVPYNQKSTSRAFESYFSGWEKENLRQIFSHTKTPCKGHCESLYQITDSRLLKRRLKKSVDTGIVYHYDDLPEAWTDTSLEVEAMVRETLGSFSFTTSLTALMKYSISSWLTPYR